jgi:UDP-N-acetylglucosamine 2-epimerase (non-hydrolysing)
VSVRVIHVVGTRPNFVKMAPVIDALSERDDVEQLIVHTGQHYDSRLSEEMIADLELPEPDVFLGIGSGRHGAQTGLALGAVEGVLVEHAPDIVCVGGDVNSTLAAALAAVKLGIPIAHVEAGLRSFDWSMPEEVNRVLTDRLSTWLFTHSPEAHRNLSNEGIASERVHYVGNTMIDSLRRFEVKARTLRAWERLGLLRREYVLVTLHRPSNVDVDAQFGGIVDELMALARETSVVFPIHPRTRARLAASGRQADLDRAGVSCLDPVGYLEFLSLQIGAGAVVTDSGGVQEETSALGIPCYTLRRNTERPVTVTHGTNTLLGDDPCSLQDVRPRESEQRRPEIALWDGRAGRRVADALMAVPMSELALQHG